MQYFVTTSENNRPKPAETLQQAQAMAEKLLNEGEENAELGVILPKEVYINQRISTGTSAPVFTPSGKLIREPINRGFDEVPETPASKVPTGLKEQVDVITKAFGIDTEELLEASRFVGLGDLFGTSSDIEKNKRLAEALNPLHNLHVVPMTEETLKGFKTEEEFMKHIHGIVDSQKK